MNYQFQITCPYCGEKHLRSFPIGNPSWNQVGIMTCAPEIAQTGMREIPMMPIPGRSNGCGESFVYSLEIDVTAEVAVAKMPELQVLP